MATATREEALYWCMNMGAKFKEPIYPPPGGWMWAEDKEDGLVLIPVFTLSEVGNDITIKEVEEFIATKPKFLTYEEASAWVFYNKDVIVKDDIYPPSGWYYTRDDNKDLLLTPVPANGEGTAFIKIPVVAVDGISSTT